jgi:hypothetical protein
MDLSAESSGGDTRQNRRYTMPRRHSYPDSVPIYLFDVFQIIARLCVAWP